MISGWGEADDDMREDLLKDWGELLEKWDGKHKTRPKQLVKLCRKVGVNRSMSTCSVPLFLSYYTYMYMYVYLYLTPCVWRNGITVTLLEKEV